MPWLGNSPSTVVKIEYRYIATASQTVFNGLDSRGATLSFDPNNYDIFRNGVKLDRDLNVSAANGSSITLVNACTVGDIILIMAYGDWQDLGTYKAADGSAANPAVTFATDLDTGMYRIGSNSIGFTLNGTLYETLSTSGSTWTSASAPPTYNFVGTDPGNVGPFIQLYHDSASPAVNDVLGEYTFKGNSSTGVARTYAAFLAAISDATNTSEDAQLQWYIQKAGTLSQMMILASTGLSVAAPLDLSSSASGQITFPTSQNASAGSNTLDDYEEGTFTPNATSSAGTITTVGTRTGWYTKIGNMVFGQIDVTITTNGTGSGFLNITGLPFTASAAVTVAGKEIQLTDKGLSGYISNGTTSIVHVEFADATYPGASGNRIMMNFAYNT
jgi:hypothetical protein